MHFHTLERCVPHLSNKDVFALSATCRYMNERLLGNPAVRATILLRVIDKMPLTGDLSMRYCPAELFVDLVSSPFVEDVALMSYFTQSLLLMFPGSRNDPSLYFSCHYVTKNKWTGSLENRRAVASLKKFYRNHYRNDDGLLLSEPLPPPPSPSRRVVAIYDVPPHERAAAGVQAGQEQAGDQAGRRD